MRYPEPPQVVELGELTNPTTINLTEGNIFRGTLRGNIVFSIGQLGCRKDFILDLTQGAGGGFTISIATQNVDPGSEFAFGQTTVGSRAIFQMASDGERTIVTGSNKTPAS